MAVALDGEPIEHLALVRPWLDRERHEHGRGSLAARLSDRSIESLAVLRAIRFERRIGPVALEGGGELLDDRRRVDLRQADVPFDAIEQRRLGKV